MSLTTSVTKAWYLHSRLKTHSASALPCFSRFGEIGVDRVTYRKGIPSGLGQDMNKHLMGRHLMGRHLMGRHLMSKHLMGRHLMSRHLRAGTL